MEDLVRGLVQYLHVLLGLLWLGGGFYTILVQAPALAAAPPPARGAVLGQLLPKQVGYLLRLGELTILTGVVNIFASGRGRLLEEYFASRWATAIILGALMAVVLLGLGHAVIKPAALRLLELGPRAAAGDTAAGVQAAAILARLRWIGYVQIVLGSLIVAAMVTARFS